MLPIFLLHVGWDDNWEGRQWLTAISWRLIASSQWAKRVILKDIHLSCESWMDYLQIFLRRKYTRGIDMMRLERVVRSLKEFLTFCNSYERFQWTASDSFRNGIQGWSIPSYLVEPRQEPVSNKRSMLRFIVSSDESQMNLVIFEADRGVWLKQKP